MRSRSYFRVFPEKGVDKQWAVPGAAVLLGMSSVTDIPHSVSLGTAVLGSAATAATAATIEWQKRHAAVTQNKLYFYYRAGQRLRQR